MWSPKLRVVRTEHVGRHGVGRVPSDLNVNLPPVTELGIPEHEHSGNEVPVHIRVSGLHIRSLHAHLVAPVTEDVSSRAELAAHQRLMLNGPHLGVRAGLCGIARVLRGGDFHLAVLKADLLLYEAHIAFEEPTVRPSPDWIAVQVQWAVELLHERQREARVAWVLLAGVRMSGDLRRAGRPSDRRSSRCSGTAAGDVRTAVVVVLASAVALARLALNVCGRAAVLLTASPC